MKPAPVDKNCQLFMAKLYNTKHWETIREMLVIWKSQQKNIVAGIDIFKEIMRSLEANEDAEEKIIEAFNKCLVKDARLTKRIIGEYQSQENPIEETPNIERVSASQQKIPQVGIQELSLAPEQIATAPKKNLTLERIKEPELHIRVQQHKNGLEIVKLIQIYLKSIITLQQFRVVLSPLYQTDPSLICTLLELAASTENRRRQNTIFAPLNDLIDKKYPVKQVGPSYVIIPQGYANYGRQWASNPQEQILNRQIVSVPLGSEVAFVIGKKNQFEEQLFQYQEQRYEIDNSLQYLKACQKMINRYCTPEKLSEPQIGESKLASALFQRVIDSLYPDQNFYNIFIRHLRLAKELLLPRIIQKKQQLQEKREQFLKICEEVAQKNFMKSLDYRCIYFAKNDRKFNTPIRWEKQIQMRRDQLIRESTNLQKNGVAEKEQIQDRESWLRYRNQCINTFDHITNQQLIQERSMNLTFKRKTDSSYPKYPDNQIYFILNFQKEDILNDVLEIILFNCTKKGLLEILIYKMLKIQIKRKVKKNEAMLSQLETQEAQNINDSNLQGSLLNETPILRDPKISRDSEQEFMQMIEQQEEATFLEDCGSPFEGPEEGHTFIGTKPIYLFFRYLLTVYQRFLKAKEYSQQKDNQKQGHFSSKFSKTDYSYKLFLNTLIYKMKEKNKGNFEECLRKIYSERAYIFFTLDKLIYGAVKIINAISNESLTYKIIKDQTRDYELGIFDWAKFPFPSVIQQLTRLYQEKQTLFRFTLCKEEGSIYVSTWNTAFAKHYDEEVYQERKELQISIGSFTILPLNAKNKLKQCHKDYEKIGKIEDFFNEENMDVFTQKGEQIILNKKRPFDQHKVFDSQLRKLKKVQNII